MRKIFRSNILIIILLIILEIQNTIVLINSSSNKISGNFFVFVMKFSDDNYREIINFPLIFMLMILILNLFMLDKELKVYDKD